MSQIPLFFELPLDTDACVGPHHKVKGWLVGDPAGDRPCLYWREP